MSEKRTWERYEDVARQLIDDIKSSLGLSMVNPDKKEFPKKDGGICEIDVSAYDMSDGKLVLVECRNKNKRLPQEEVHGFAYRIQQTNAKRGIIVTPIGLQKGAIIAANGLTLTFEPTIFGVIKFPSRNCTKAKTPATPTAYQIESFVSNAIKMGKIEPIIIPK